MNIVMRLVVIAFKLVKLGVLLTLVHGVGSQFAEYLRASLALALQRQNATPHAFPKKSLRPFRLSQHL